LFRFFAYAPASAAGRSIGVKTPSRTEKKRASGPAAAATSDGSVVLSSNFPSSEAS
jgi:hypothetical protein